MIAAPFVLSVPGSYYQRKGFLEGGTP
jgi:hypothetical protein